MHLDYSRDRFQCVDGLAGSGRHGGRVIAVELDLDRLRHRRQVADQVGHQLNGLDFQPGYFARDALPDLTHDRLDRAPGKRLQAHEHIALVGLGEAAAELQAGAARVTGDFRHCADNVFHLQHQPVGFAQGQTRRGDVVEHEPALIHLGHEAGRYLR